MNRLLRVIAAPTPALAAEKERRRLQFLIDVIAARLDDFNRSPDGDLGLWAVRSAWREWQMADYVRDHFHFVKTRYFVLFGFWLSIVPFASAQDRGVIDDPAGSVNVQAHNRPDAAIIAKVKTGEQVSFECKEGDKWCKVTLASGKSGWVPSNCITRYFTKKDLPRKGGELGVDYYKVARSAAQGDSAALKKFFSFTGQLDGAGAEEHCGVVGTVIHIIGDDKLADFLRSQPQANLSINDEATYPFESAEYLRRHFPKTYKLLFPHEKQLN